MKYHDRDRQGQSFNIPHMYKVPYIHLGEQERAEQTRLRPSAAAPRPSQFTPGKPRKLIFIVSFKCSRVDPFFLFDNTGLEIKEGDIVVVEADRGQDLGTVQHANITEEEAKLYKKKYGEEQYKWLMMFSKSNTAGSVNPNALMTEDFQQRTNLLVNAPPTMQGIPRDSYSNLKLKAIKRLASAHEIRMLTEKETSEAKAKRTCQQKVAALNLHMEILDAEWQWDFQKLIFYYYADHYINFKELITELYRIYKTRIWLSAINPASFSSTAMGQPPSGIGPGAVIGSGSNNNSMAYSADPDPYGAIPPYRINYNTYTPNYAEIPGVPNSFPPSTNNMTTHAYSIPNNDPMPAVPPGVAAPTGTLNDYNYYYERNPLDGQMGVAPFDTRSELGSNNNTITSSSAYGSPLPTNNHNGASTGNGLSTYGAMGVGFGGFNQYFGPSAGPQRNIYARMQQSENRPAFAQSYLSAPIAAPSPPAQGSWRQHNAGPSNITGRFGEMSLGGPTIGAGQGRSGFSRGPVDSSSFSALMSRHLGSNSSSDFVPAQTEAEKSKAVLRDYLKKL